MTQTREYQLPEYRERDREEFDVRASVYTYKPVNPLR